MSGIAAIVEELLMSAMLSEKNLPRKSKMDWALTALSILLGGAGVFLSILGLTRFLEGKYTPDMAALLSAAGVFTSAILAASVVAYRDSRRREMAAAIGAARNDLGKNIRSLVEDVCSELDEPVRENPKTAVLLAAVAGFLTAQQRSAL